MSPQLQQVLNEIDRLSSIQQIQVIEYINARKRNLLLQTTYKYLFNLSKAVAVD